MSLRTRRGLALLASMLFVAAACAQGTPSAAPTTASQPPAATEEATSAAPEETTAAATTEASATAEATTEASGTAEATGGAGNIDDKLFGSEYAPAEGTDGGSVVIADWQIPEHMNYYYQNGFVNTQVIQATMRGLWTISHDAKWVPDLGVTVPSISNGMIRIDEEHVECPESATNAVDTPGFEMDLDIKPGLLWSDGEVLDLTDLRYTWEWILDPDQANLVSGTNGWDLIDSFEVADDGLTATVHFCSGFSGNLGLLSSPMMPEHYASEIPVADHFEKLYPVGPDSVDAPVSGPFKYASLSPSAIELVRNENFKAGVGGRNAPAYLDRVVYQFFDGAKDAMIASALSGEIDVATDLLQFDVPAIEGQLPDTHELLVDTAWEYEHFDFNQSGKGPGEGHPALTDPNVRMALAQSIDKTALYETVSPGTAMPEEEPCAPTPPGLYFRTEEGLTCIEYDVDAANAALDAAGWTDTNGDGIRDKDGVELSLLHCHTGAPFRVASGDFLASQFQAIGVELKNTPSPETVFAPFADGGECNLAAGNYDTSEFAWVATFDLYGNYYNTYHSSGIPTDENGGAGSNYIRLEDPSMDEVLERLFGATDPVEAEKLAIEVQQLHTELQPEVVLYYRSSARVVNTKLENFFKNPGTTSDMWNIEDWFLAE